LSPLTIEVSTTSMTGKLFWELPFFDIDVFMLK
jgi:hypothetical protein